MHCYNCSCQSQGASSRRVTDHIRSPSLRPLASLFVPPPPNANQLVNTQWLLSALTFLASTSCLALMWVARDRARSWHTEVTLRTLRTCRHQPHTGFRGLRVSDWLQPHGACGKRWAGQRHESAAEARNHHRCVPSPAACLVLWGCSTAHRPTPPTAACTCTCACTCASLQHPVGANGPWAGACLVAAHRLLQWRLKLCAQRFTACPSSSHQLSSPAHTRARGDPVMLRLHSKDAHVDAHQAPPMRAFGACCTTTQTLLSGRCQPLSGYHPRTAQEARSALG